MQITINGETEKIIENGLTISGLLKAKKVESPDLVSVQRNGKFIDREKYSATVVSENDEIDFLYFMGGGGAGR